MIKFAEKLNRLVLALALTALAVSILIIMVQIVLRYVFSYSLAWGEELARYLNITMVLLGSSIVILEDTHPRIDTLHLALPPRYRRALSDFFTVLTSIFLIVLIWQGIGLCLFAWDDFTSALQIRWTFPYLSIPVGGALMLVQLWARSCKDRQR